MVRSRFEYFVVLQLDFKSKIYLKFSPCLHSTCGRHDKAVRIVNVLPGKLVLHLSSPSFLVEIEAATNDRDDVVGFEPVFLALVDFFEEIEPVFHELEHNKSIF